MSIDRAYVLCGGSSSRFESSLNAELKYRRNPSRYLANSHRKELTLPDSFIFSAEHKLKFLVPINGRPILWHKMNQLSQHGIRRFELLAGQNAKDTVEALGGFCDEWAVNVHGMPKTKNRGGLSRLLTATKKIGDQDFLVVAADTISDLDVSHFVESHYRAKKDVSFAFANVGTESTSDFIASRKFMEFSEAFLGWSDPKEQLWEALYACKNINQCDCFSRSFNLNTLADFADLLSDSSVDTLITPPPLPKFPLSDLRIPRVLLEMFGKRQLELPV